jgi:polysaccharide export outer membrane protein
MARAKRLLYFPVLSWCLLAATFGAAELTAQTQQPAGIPEPPADQNPSTVGQPLNRTLNPSVPATPSNQSNQAPPIAQAPRELPPDTIRPNYVLAPNDQILIRTQAEEINEKPFRIDGDGNINLPLLGRVHAGGLTLQELENDLTTRLREYIREPQVIIQVTQFHSAPVFFVGAFKAPGIYPLQGTRTLMEMLTQIGGLQPNASQRITITRRAEYGPIPLPNAVEDPQKKISTVEISLASLRQNVNPAEDIVLQPYDQISVERAEQIYVSGEVMRTGGVDLGERESISIAQVLTMAGGFNRDALRGKVRILRPIEGTTRRAAIEVDLKRILEGKENDIPLLPNDIVYVPRSYTRAFWTTFSQFALMMAPYAIFILVQ